MKRSLKKYDNGGKTKRPVFPGKLDNRVVSDNTSVQRPTIQKQNVRLKTPQEVKKANRENFQKRIGVKPTYNVQELTDFGTPEPGIEYVPVEAALLPGTPAIKGLGTAGNFALDMVNPLSGSRGLKVKPKELLGSVNADDVVKQLRQELLEKGIVESQKTLNLPWKEPIRKGIRPWGYDTKDKIIDLKSLFKDVKNPNYATPDKVDRVYNTYLKTVNDGDVVLSKDDYIKTLNQEQFFKSNRDKVNNRFNTRFNSDESLGDVQNLAAKNRYATWDMYLGKPQTEHPMYDISELTKSKDDVIYTIKKDFIDEEAGHRLSDYIHDIEASVTGVPRPGGGKPKKMTKKGDSWIIPDTDNGIFGTMGGFHWKVDKLPDGNYKAIANDVWDLQPFKNRTIGDSDKLSGRLLNKAIKPIQNIEIGKTLGIGKPLNVKVGFNIDGKTKKIINTFGLAPATAIGAGALQQNQKEKQFAKGGVIKDNRGQWAHPGKITEIGSNNITMQGVNYPVLGISDQGDTQMMYPEQNYQFKGSKVTEYPMMQRGGTVKPIVVNNPNDPRLKAYNDSLFVFENQNRYNDYVKTPKVVTRKYEDVWYNDPVHKDINYNEAMERLFKLDAFNKGIKPNGNYSSVKYPEMFKTGENIDKEIYNESTGETKIIKTPILVHKQPVQPYIYQKPNGTTQKSASHTRNYRRLIGGILV